MPQLKLPQAIIPELSGLQAITEIMPKYLVEREIGFALNTI
jgi:hypothetical protein